jgi:glutathione S-transferase
MTTTIVGNYVSPYVRKVLVALALKGVPYEIDPLVPFFGDAAFEELSPLRRIPVLIDDEVTLTDSTVICEYLDERYAGAPLLPASPADRARARWLEEFADTRLCDVLIWRLFFQRAIRPSVFGEPTDETKVAEALNDDLPTIMDYLEAQAPETGFLFGAAPSIADIAVACPFKNAMFIRCRPDPARWPHATGWVARMLQHDAFRALEPFETVSLKTPVAEHRAALQATGAPIAKASHAADRPRKGVMRLDL